MPIVLFLGISIGGDEIPIETQSSCRELKFSTREKNSGKLTSLVAHWNCSPYVKYF